MKKFLSIALFAAIGSASFANSTSDGDVLFNLLKQEVNYYYSHLSKDSVPVNQITLNVLQEKGVTIQSNMGYASVNETNWRRLSPIMRIGKTESYQGRNGSVIHPKSILFPLLEMKVGAIDSKKCERFVELRH